MYREMEVSLEKLILEQSLEKLVNLLVLLVAVEEKISQVMRMKAI